MKKDFLPVWPNRRSKTSTEHTPDIHPVTSAHDQLVTSMNMLRAYPDLAPEQKEALTGIVTADAQNFAAQLVPPAVAHELSLERPRTDTTELVPPTINDVYLLANASDATADPAIHDALGYILAYEAPTFSEILHDAYQRAGISGNPIMFEEHVIGGSEDIRLDPLIQDYVLSRDEQQLP
jgi:hypothetical protein